MINNKKIILLDIFKDKKGKYQYYLDWFKEAWIRNGGEIKRNISLPFKLRLIAAKLHLGHSSIFRSKKNAILVIGGPYIDLSSFPYSYFNEIIPVIWDSWNPYRDLMISSLKRNKIKHAFFTQKDTSEFVKKSAQKIETYWLPEAIDVKAYKQGDNLNSRSIDILSFGRKYTPYHACIKDISNHYNYIFSNNDLHLIFKDFEELVNGISSSKVIVCFPRSYTHPELAGGIETLTQRYWEGILSRCLIIGKAPDELITLIGYNPVIEVDWNNPKDQIEKILSNIKNYQNFVDNNYNVAVNICSWNTRVSELIQKLLTLGYEI